jgi:endonuclease-3 related protein
MDIGRRLNDLYQRLFARFGPQGWWPGETPLETAVGAMLTQNTNWTNASKAIANLKEAGLLSLEGLRSLSPDQLAEFIRPAGYYNLKARRLGALLDFLAQDLGGDPAALADLPLAEARRALLGVKGVGPETADSILLYAAGLPVFVVDAYTFRILGRHDLAPEGMTYDEMQACFMDHLPREAGLFNEYHALLVRLGKEFCKKGSPRCKECPALGW